MSRALADRREQAKKKKRTRSRHQENNDSSDENDPDPDEVCMIHCLPIPTMTLCKQSVFFNLYEKGETRTVKPTTRPRLPCFCRR